MPKRARNKRGPWGGARDGAGRPAKGARSSEPHRKRAAIASAQMLVTARLHDKLRDVPSRTTRSAFAPALARSLARTDFRIVRLAVRAREVELIVKAADARALARGMQGFQVSAARSLNRALRRKGNVFPDRYRAVLLASVHSPALITR